MRYEVPNTKTKAIVSLIILAIFIALFVFYFYPNEIQENAVIMNYGYLYGRELNAVLCN